MLALKNFCSKGAPILLLLAAVLIFSSCATKQEPQLVSDGATRESSLPWNQQQKWENQGTLGPISERFQGR
ncbi:MAG: hypothetical protein ABI883_05150 [Chthoniobacterales bacterium]